MSADLILTITDRSRGGDFSAWFREQGATLVLTALGRGTATTEVLDCLGLEATEKAVLLCMLPSRKGLLRKAAKDLWLDVPGRGVMMAVPVSWQVGRMPLAAISELRRNCRATYLSLSLASGSSRIDATCC